MRELKIGDVVVLKSGSPDMTIQAFGNNNNVKCMWFAENDVKQEVFSIESLELADDE